LSRFSDFAQKISKGSASALLSYRELCKQEAETCGLNPTREMVRLFISQSVENRNIKPYFQCFERFLTDKINTINTTIAKFKYTNQSPNLE